MKRLLFLSLFLAPPGFAQEPGPAAGPDAGAKKAQPFTRIRLAPAEVEPTEREAPRGESPAPRPPRGKPIRIQAPEVEAPADVGPPQKVKQAAKPEKKKKRKRRRRRVQLKGTGDPNGVKTLWGVVETITPLEAARRVAETGGAELELERQVRFRHDTVRFTKDSKAALQEIIDRLQSTPEIRLLLIEGHADYTGALRYNQKLSEARASAVREALVRGGVAPERLLAYGYGETRPTSKKRARNRRVVFRIVEGDRPALTRRRATEWGQMAVVGLWGGARWGPSPETDADDEAAAKPDAAAKPEAAEPGEVVPAEEAPPPAQDAAEAPPPELDWQPLEFKAQLNEGVDVETEADGRALLRLPDLSRILVEPNTRLRVSKLFFDSATGKSYTAVKLRRGTVHVMLNPMERSISRGLFAFGRGAVETISADFTLAVDAQGKGHLSVDRGRVEIANGASSSTALPSGQHIALGVDGARPRSKLGAPEIVAPRRGDFGQPPPLEWEPVKDAAGYLVEIAADVDFYQSRVRHRVGTTRYVAEALDKGETWYWRVFPLAADQSMGRSSRIHAFRVVEGAPAPVKPPKEAPKKDAKPRTARR